MTVVPYYSEDPFAIDLIHANGNIPCFVNINSGTPKFLVGGFNLCIANGSTTVWGAGLDHPDQLISPAAKIVTVRGPLSAARVRACGGTCPDVFGDLGLLLPRFVSGQIHETKLVGLVPGRSEQERLFRLYDGHDNVCLISADDSIANVVNRVTKCGFIVSSSMTALVIAVAYRIPFLWAKFSEGNDFKFWDFFLSLGISPPRCFDFTGPELPPDWFALYDEATQAPEFDNFELWQSCPF